MNQTTQYFQSSELPDGNNIKNLYQLLWEYLIHEILFAEQDTVS